MNIYDYPYRPNSQAGFVIKALYDGKFFYVHHVYTSMGGLKNIMSNLKNGFYVSNYEGRFRPYYIFAYKIIEKRKYELFSALKRSFENPVKIDEITNEEYKVVLTEIAGDYSKKEL